MSSVTKNNRPFTHFGHMVGNKLRWEANNAVGLPKQRNSYQSSPTFLCFESPTGLFASQHNLFRTMWQDRAKRLFHYIILPIFRLWRNTFDDTLHLSIPMMSLSILFLDYDVVIFYDVNSSGIVTSLCPFVPR